MKFNEFFKPKKDPYIPSKEKRYYVSEDKYSRGRINALRDIHHELEQEYKISLSLAIHGSLIKGKVLTPEIASRADMDMYLYFEAEGMSQQEREKTANTLREQTLKKLQDRQTQLGYANIPSTMVGMIDRHFKVIPLDSFSIPRVVGVVFRKIPFPSIEEDRVRLANFFSLSIGAPIKKYRNQFLLGLGGTQGGEDVWKRIEAVIEHVERRGNIPATLRKRYPKTLKQAFKTYGVS